MRLRILFIIQSLVALQFVSALAAEELSTDSVSGSAVVREMNLARQNPALYATYLEELRSQYTGNCLVLPGQTRIYTKEGLKSVDEAIRFLRSVRPLQPLTLSPGLCHGAADHCATQARGAVGHGNPASRMNRYGNWAAAWGENIAYGKTTARAIVMALIIDDGLPARKHRANIFAAKFNYAGAAYGPHARYGSVCSIDFAGGYAERDAGLLARNY